MGGRDADEECASAAERLGARLRLARRERGHGNWSLAWVAARVGRSRVWLNRVELGYAKDGGYPLPTDADLLALGQLLEIDAGDLLALRDEARLELDKREPQRRAPTQHQGPSGRRAQVAIFRGDENVYRAAADLLERQSSDARLKVTHVVTLQADPEGMQPYQRDYVSALAEFLRDNRRTAALERAVHAPSSDALRMAKAKTEALAGTRAPQDVHNIETRFCLANPVLLDVLIGEREAMISVPDHRGHPTLSASILISDSIFVEALKTWFQQIVWKSAGVPIEYATATATFAALDNAMTSSHEG